MRSRSDHIWRFIDSGAATGAFNMAVDETLAVLPATLRPTLRVYCWSPYTISFGYHQSVKQLNAARLQEDEIDLVRRPTGGRAILHAHEVTYSVTIPAQSAWFQSSNSEIYNEVSEALLTGLKIAGLNARLTRREQASSGFRNYRQRVACFAASSRDEIQYGTQKLVGSAQRRYGSALLQHGSIILGKAHLNLPRYFSASGNGELNEQLQEKTTCLETILARTVSYGEIAASLKRGFENHFKIKFQTSRLTAEELLTVEELQPKYSELRSVVS